MTDSTFYHASHGAILAYNSLNTAKSSTKSPGIVFFGGFRSDMSGTKALFIENWAKRQSRAFLRFDYSGHGASSGAFLNGCIGDWARDAQEIVEALTTGPQIFVGSSMGGWIALLLARQVPQKVAGLVGIAAAPDFTEDDMWGNMTTAQRELLQVDGQISVPSDYSEEPYIITRRLIEDGRDQLVLRAPLNLNFPVRLLHGTEDKDVPMSVPLHIVEHATCDDLNLTLVKGADHRFSRPENLTLITQTIEEITALL